MRALAGPLILHFGLFIAGLGVLRGLRALPSLTPRRVLAAAGLAYLVGVAVVFQLCILFLVIGLPFGLPMVSLTCAFLALPLVLEPKLFRGLVRRPAPMRGWSWRIGGVDRRLAAITLAAFAVLFVIGLFTVGNAPLVDYDAWNLWGRKAGLLFFGGHLPLQVLASTASGYIHPDYPMVLPLLEAAHLRALGSYDLGSLHLVVWILGGAFVWAGGFLASRLSRPIVWAPLLVGAFALTATELVTAYADLPMAFYLCLGVLSLGAWLEGGRREFLIIAALLLAGAAGIKNEGLLGAVVTLLAGLIVLAITRRTRQLVELVVASGAIVVLAVLPWRLWLAAHGLKGDIPLGQGLDPSFLLGRTSRIGASLQALEGQLVSVSTIAVLVPIALALLALLMYQRYRPRLVGYYLLAGVLYFASIVWAYWAGPIGIQFWLATSANRTYIGAAFIALAALIHLATPVLQTRTRPREAPAEVAPEQPAAAMMGEPS
jgi:hypothetical protein